MTVFATPYVTSGLGLAAAQGPRAISAFWFGLLLGRLSPLLARGHQLGAGPLVLSGVVACAVLGAGAALGVRQVAIVFGATGLALGAVYPLMISLAGRRFPNARGTAAGMTAGAGAVGGFVIPWMSGALGDAVGIVAAIMSLALWSLLIALGGYGAGRVMRRPARS